MDWSFEVVGADSVRAVLASGHSVLQEALDDSIGTRPPPGASQDGPSTYWIDQAIQGLRARRSQPSDRPFAEGNITDLRLRGDLVIASYDFASEEEGEPVDAAEFLSLLTAWRAAAVSFDPASEDRLPPLREAIPL